MSQEESQVQEIQKTSQETLEKEELLPDEEGPPISIESTSTGVSYSDSPAETEDEISSELIEEEGEKSEENTFYFVTHGRLMETEHKFLSRPFRKIVDVWIEICSNYTDCGLGPVTPTLKVFLSLKPSQAGYLGVNICYVYHLPFLDVRMNQGQCKAYQANYDIFIIQLEKWEIGKEHFNKWILFINGGVLGSFEDWQTPFSSFPEESAVGIVTYLDSNGRRKTKFRPKGLGKELYIAGGAIRDHEYRINPKDVVVQLLGKKEKTHELSCPIRKAIPDLGAGMTSLGCSLVGGNIPGLQLLMVVPLELIGKRQAEDWEGATRKLLKTKGMRLANTLLKEFENKTNELLTVDMQKKQERGERDRLKCIKKYAADQIETFVRCSIQFKFFSKKHPLGEGMHRWVHNIPECNDSQFNDIFKIGVDLLDFCFVTMIGEFARGMEEIYPIENRPSQNLIFIFESPPSDGEKKLQKACVGYANCPFDSMNNIHEINRRFRFEKFKESGCKIILSSDHDEVKKRYECSGHDLYHPTFIDNGARVDCAPPFDWWWRDTFGVERKWKNEFPLQVAYTSIIFQKDANKNHVRKIEQRRNNPVIDTKVWPGDLENGIDGSFPLILGVPFLSNYVTTISGCHLIKGGNTVLRLFDPVMDVKERYLPKQLTIMLKTLNQQISPFVSYKEMIIPCGGVKHTQFKPPSFLEENEKEVSEQRRQFEKQYGIEDADCVHRFFEPQLPKTNNMLGNRTCKTCEQLLCIRCGRVRFKEGRGKTTIEEHALMMCRYCFYELFEKDEDNTGEKNPSKHTKARLQAIMEKVDKEPRDMTREFDFAVSESGKPCSLFMERHQTERRNIGTIPFGKTSEKRLGLKFSYDGGEKKSVEYTHIEKVDEISLETSKRLVLVLQTQHVDSINDEFVIVFKPNIGKVFKSAFEREMKIAREKKKNATKNTLQENERKETLAK